jgi:2',3'-cyclic-nucleotide 2'-phosphodiesterase (5'-nucleotidase family)
MSWFLKTYFIMPLVILCLACSSKYVYQVSEYQYSYEKIDSSLIDVDSTLYHIVLPYKDSLDKTMNDVIAISAATLSKTKPESTLGNLLADATRTMASQYLQRNIDVALINYGGIRVPSLSAGDVTTGNVYEIMPFDNFLVVIEVSGEILTQVLDAVAYSGGWPISGLSFQIAENGKATNIAIGGKNINNHTIYTLALSDYVANGGDNMSMLTEISQINTGKLLRDVFLEYFTAKGIAGEKLNAQIEGRITKP